METKQSRINAAFAEIIRRICARNLVDPKDFINEIDQPVEIATKLYHGQHEWLGFVTFRQLDRFFKSTPGHMEQVYRKVVENYDA
jgi:hypothetical protein